VHPAGARSRQPREESRHAECPDDGNRRGREFAAAIGHRFGVVGQHPFDRGDVTGRQQVDEPSKHTDRARAPGGRRCGAASFVRVDGAARAVVDDPHVPFSRLEHRAHFGGRVVECVAQQQHGALGRRQRLERL